MINWLLTGIAAGGAFLLSFIIGLFSEVTFGALLMRAFLWALIFAAFVNVAAIILKRFIPDLFEPLSETDDGLEEEDSGQAEDTSGAKVNIVLGDDLPTETDGEFLEESSGDEGFPAKPGVFVAQGLESVGSLDNSDEDDVQELAAAEDGDEAPVAAPEPGGGAVPDIGQFEGDFSGGGSIEDISGTGTGTGTGNVQSADVMGSTHDTDEMARAVHTILQKDQEG